MAWEFLTAPRVVFGAGVVARLPEITGGLGSRALLVLGGASADHSGLTGRLQELLPVAALQRCAGEPTAGDVERVVAAARAAGCDHVVAAGGGSALDCGKAAAAMLQNPGSLEDYLEGVGSGRQVEVQPLPVVAVPTTAGTGSEVTKNAVISGPGYKKSIRSPMMIPEVALVDPELALGTPAAVTAACGMDALTQVLEPCLSNRAQPMTDALALKGVELSGRFLARACEDPADLEARQGLALASLLGGICLANAGLGAVHGFASPLGALFPVAHGVACAALLPQVVRANLQASRGGELQGRVWGRFASVAEALTGRRFDDHQAAADAGLAALETLQARLEIPRLAQLGIGRQDFGRIVAGARGSSMRYNPVTFDDQQLHAILEAAL
jgi:alcohol dehydrogenase class IV